MNQALGGATTYRSCPSRPNQRSMALNIHALFLKALVNYLRLYNLMQVSRFHNLPSCALYACFYLRFFQFVHCVSASTSLHE